MARWRYPSLSVHGVEGAWADHGAKTVIPGRVIGKFSLRFVSIFFSRHVNWYLTSCCQRLVPDMEPDRVIEVVGQHLRTEFEKLGTPMYMKFHCEHPGKPWLADPTSPNFTAAARAITRIFNTAPDFTREGGSIPITLVFEEIAPVMLLPMGACDDGAHSQNEKMDRFNYVGGIKVLASYLHELAALVK